MLFDLYSLMSWNLLGKWDGYQRDGVLPQCMRLQILSMDHLLKANISQMKKRPYR